MENQIINILMRNGILENIDITCIDIDNIKGKLLTIEEGTILYREGDPSNVMYLIVSGEINLITKDLDGASNPVILKDDDYFGHSEILSDISRNTTAVVLRDSYLIMLSKKEFQTLIEADEKILDNLLKNTSFELPSVSNNSDDEFAALFSDESAAITDNDAPEPFNLKTETNDITSVNLFADEQIDFGQTESVSEESTINFDDSIDLQETEPVNSFYDETSVDETNFLQNENPVMNESKSDEEIHSPFEDQNFDNEFADEADKLIEQINHKPVEEHTKSEHSVSEVLSNSQIRMIIKAAELVNSGLKIDEVLQNIVTVACEITNADRGTLYLVDKDRQELWSKIAMGKEIREIRLNIGEGVAGWVAKSNETVNIKDAKQDNRYTAKIDKSSGYETRSMLCLPVKNKEKETIGVLQLLNSNNGFFSQTDEELLNAISIQSAIALENAKLMENLLQGERVSSLGKMSNFLIQDIKKPVLVSKRYAEHLKSKNLPQDVVQVIDMLLEQINYVADLVQTTSSYAEGSKILRTIDTTVKEVIEDFCNRVDVFVRSKNCYIVQNTDMNGRVKVDLKEFFQCFNHIIKNACDAMPDGGDIKITTYVEKGRVNITFKDNGMGIPDSIKDKIFEPFITHGKKEGTGLGLSITKKIVEDHGGKILVHSELGEGAEFTISLPEASPF